MHTPGPWRQVRVETGAYYTHHIQTTEGHIASVAGWTTIGTTCPTTEANARLIAYAPDLADTVHDLLAWARDMGGWEAPCWRRAETILATLLSPHEDRD